MQPGGSRAGLFPLWTALLIFSPFIVDATVTLLRRLRHGEKDLGSTPDPLLPAAGVARLGTPPNGAGRVHPDGGLRRDRPCWRCACRPPGNSCWRLGWIVIYGLLLWGVGRLERQRATVSAP